MARRRARNIQLTRLVVLGLVAASLAVTGSAATITPAGADGNEAIGAPLAARAITAGASDTCAVLPSGRVKCWGGGTNGRLGQDSTTNIGGAPGQMAALDAVNLGVGRTATAITAGDSHTCAVLDDSTVKCWGDGGQGRLGQDKADALGDNPGEMAALPAINLGAGRTATAITAGFNHTCAVLDDATVKCWGFGAGGALGQDDTANLGDTAGEMAALAPVNLGVPLTVRLTAQGQVTPGSDIDYHLTITNETAAAVTGVTVTDAEAPACAQALPDIASGQTRTVDCSYTATGADFPTRANTATVDTDQTAPVASNRVDVAVGHPITTAAAVSAGGQHSCALLDDGTVKCWGTASYGQLGHGSTTTLGDEPGEMAILPSVDLGAGRTATAISATAYHTCALRDDGSVVCWGAGANGRLGQDRTDDVGDGPDEMGDPLPPVDLGAGRTATAITAGANHTCALLDDATVKCWGYGAFGQLGQGSTDDIGDEPGEMAALPPVDLGTGRTATAISAGGNHTCALLDDATVKCWGDAGFGALGQDDPTTLGDDPGEMAALPPVDLGSGRTATAISAGGTHTCAVLDDATVKCWGYGAFGQLGQGSTHPLGDEPGDMAALPPVDLGAGRTATAISAGIDQHTCARLDDGTVKCWGRNTGGQLGQGSNTNLGDGPGEMAGLPAIVLGLGTGPASLTAVLTVDDVPNVAPGQTLGYHLTVTNTGVPALSGITVSDPNVSDCEQTVPDLAAGAQHTIDCSYTAKATDVGTFSHTATVDSAQTAPVTSNTVLVTVAIPRGHGVVSGTVTGVGSGDPIDGAVVAVLSTATYTPVAITVADANGSYTALAPTGNYLVYALDPTGAHAAGFAGAPTTVTVTDGGTVDADAQLTSTRGTISGTVSEDGTGTPLPDVVALSVNLSRNGRPGAGTITDSAGQYSIRGLTPSDRLVGFVDLSGTHAPEYYDNVPTPAGAQVVPVTGSATATADAALPTQAAHGTSAHLVGDITSSQTGAALTGIAVFALRASDYTFVGGDLTDGRGYYDLALDPGNYKLAFYDPTGAHLMEWNANRPYDSAVTADSVSATAGFPLDTDAALTPINGAAAGTVTQTGSGDPLTGIKVIATDNNGTVVGVATTTTDGTYTLAGLEPGSYRFRFTDLTGAHIDEYHDNAPDYAGATPITITAGVVTTGINAALDLTP